MKLFTVENEHLIVKIATIKDIAIIALITLLIPGIGILMPMHYIQAAHEFYYEISAENGESIISLFGMALILAGSFLIGILSYKVGMARGKQNDE